MTSALAGTKVRLRPIFNWYFFTDTHPALVSRSQPNKSGRRTKASAAFSEDAHIKEVVTSLFQADSEGAQALLHDEIQSLVIEVEKESLDESDLIFDRKNITGLCLLYTSMVRFI